MPNFSLGVASQPLPFGLASAEELALEINSTKRLQMGYKGEVFSGQNRLQTLGCVQRCTPQGPSIQYAVL